MMTSHSTASHDLPSCFGERGAVVDLGEFHVTLDVVCLVLPPEADPELPTAERPCYARLTSFASCASAESPPPPPSPTKTDAVTFISTASA